MSSIEVTHDPIPPSSISPQAERAMLDEIRTREGFIHVKVDLLHSTMGFDHDYLTLLMQVALQEHLRITSKDELTHISSLDRLNALKVMSAALPELIPNSTQNQVESKKVADSETVGRVSFEKELREAEAKLEAHKRSDYLDECIKTLKKQSELMERQQVIIQKQDIIIDKQDEVIESQKIDNEYEKKEKEMWIEMFEAEVEAAGKRSREHIEYRKQLEDDRDALLTVAIKLTEERSTDKLNLSRMEDDLKKAVQDVISLQDSVMTRNDELMSSRARLQALNQDKLMAEAKVELLEVQLRVNHQEIGTLKAMIEAEGPSPLSEKKRRFE
jgi:chromosome segregation ATPase